MEELLFRYNPWWEGEYKLEGVCNRDSVLNSLIERSELSSIIMLAGLRRVGKTTLMRLFIRHLIEKKKIKPTRIFYISLDDYLLRESNILEIVDEYRKLHKISFDEKIYLFLDEVTYQKDFEIQLKNIYDTHNAKVIASSSSASVMKSKKPYLTGRSALIEVLPLDFKEYLEFKKISVQKKDKILLGKYFEEYMSVGGMPEYVLKMDSNYLKDLVDDIINKDIVAMYGVKEVQTLKDFFVLLMERSGKILSINKIGKILKIAPDTSRRYLKMFEDTYLIYVVQRSGKTNETVLSPKKIYAADLGIRTAFTGIRDLGSFFENYVFLKIKNYLPKYVYHEKHEIDFLTAGKTLIEVKYGLPMSEDQSMLFNSTEAKKKMIINGIGDMGKLEGIG